VEKTKSDEKETKKLQDSVQSLQLRLAAREHICRNLQEKVRTHKILVTVFSFDFTSYLKLIISTFVTGSRS